jgi:hypothetical protein
VETLSGRLASNFKAPFSKIVPPLTKKHKMELNFSLLQPVCSGSRLIITVTKEREVHGVELTIMVYFYLSWLSGQNCLLKLMVIHPQQQQPWQSQ